jgi:uncharacterized Tic20 family protein
MTRHTAQSDQLDSTEEPHARLWSGMIAFAAMMLLLVGGFHVLGGFVALFEDNQYEVGSSELMVSVNYKVWGVFHMAIGVTMCLAGVSLFYRRTWARVVAVVVSSISAVTNLAFLDAAPVWYTLMILIDVLIIYAVTVHSDSEPEYDY